MLLKSLTLRNIRSYKDATITFPEGIVLLAGDIGSGKSSILQAIEFALFGIIRGGSSGSELLRHGSPVGMVELTADVDGSEITIRRTLKVQGTSVMQGPGYLTQGGYRKELSPSELKSLVLQILGYPESMLTKGKGLLYRYTLYTPQEDMKTILEEDTEARLETIRKLFGIDKYKTAKKNAAQYAKALFPELRSLDEQAKDREQIQKNIAEQTALLTRLMQERDTGKAALAEKSRLLSELAVKIKEDRTKKEEAREKEGKLAALKKEQQFLITKSSGATALKERLLTEITQLQKTATAKVATLQNPEELRKKQTEILSALQSAKSTIARESAFLEQETNIRERVTKLGTCPICLQAVTDDHKTHITTSKNTAISTYQSTILSVKEKERQLTLAYAEIGKKIEEQIQLTQQKLKEERDAALLLEKNARLEMLDKEHSIEQKHTHDIAQQIIALEKEISSAKELLAQYAQREYELLQMQTEEKKLSTLLSANEERIVGTKKLLATYHEQIVEKNKLAEKSKSLAKTRSWILETLAPALDTIEIHVFGSIHDTLSKYFVSWVKVLLDDETFAIRLDENFSPKIQQNGFESTYGQLSGGERTAVALAYRLALSSVVHDLAGNIKTKGLLILDEPTDGFSTEQLEKVRTLLGNLRHKQVLMVSHEKLLETFADHTIRIQKNNGESKILATPIALF